MQTHKLSICLACCCGVSSFSLELWKCLVSSSFMVRTSTVKTVCRFHQEIRNKASAGDSWCPMRRLSFLSHSSPSPHLLQFIWFTIAASSSSEGSVLWPLLASTLSGTATERLESQHAEGTHWSSLHSNSLYWILMSHHAPGRRVSSWTVGWKKKSVMEDWESCGCSIPLTYQPPFAPSF